MKQINGYTIINSAALPGDGRGTVILGARSLNYNSDDYEYVVAEVENLESTYWPSGDYSRTLDLALQKFNDQVGRATGRPSCGHAPAGNSGWCAEMACRNYVNKHDDELTRLTSSSIPSYGERPSGGLV